MDESHDWHTKQEWQKAYVEEMVRYLSKTGSIGIDDVLFELARVLPKEDILQLYISLRDSKRPEIEWRGEFLSVFTSVREDDLPPVMYDQPSSNHATTRRPLNIQSDSDIPF